MHPLFLFHYSIWCLGKKIGVVFFMTSEHWKIYPYLAGEAFQGLGEKIRFDSNQSQAFSVDSIITSSKASYRGILLRKNI